MLKQNYLTIKIIIKLEFKKKININKVIKKKQYMDKLFVIIFIFKKIGLW